MVIPKGGRPFCGEALGILMLDMKAPCIPSNIGNANFYDFPVRYEVLNSIPCAWWFNEKGASKERLKIFI